MPCHLATHLPRHRHSPGSHPVLCPTVTHPASYLTSSGSIICESGTRIQGDICLLRTPEQKVAKTQSLNHFQGHQLLGLPT